MEILYAVITLSGMGLVFGLVLALASKYLSVEQDEKVPMIIEVLPGANCGGCGYAGCSAYAQAVVDGTASTSQCPVGGETVAKKVAEIIGVKPTVADKKYAKVLCSGTNDVAKNKYIYDGNTDCISANRLSGGQKSCTYSCLGLGTCANECPFDAIIIENGVAKISKEKCVACGKCVKICPKNVIELIPETAQYTVQCSSKDKGNIVKDKCSVGCIACKICEKACEYDAITVVDCIAKIDYTKCINCGECEKKCPKKIIVRNF